MLFVIALVAAVISMSAYLYKSYQQRIETAGVRSDIRILLNALERYYHIIGCNEHGIFPVAKLQPSIVVDLGLKASFQHRPPIVRAYAVRIAPTGEYTQQDKPVYRLIVTAQLGAGLTEAKKQWLAQRLNASQWIANQLVWTVLPNNSLSHVGNALWVLDGARELFVRQFSFGDKPYSNKNAYFNCVH